MRMASLLSRRERAEIFGALEAEGDEFSGGRPFLMNTADAMKKVDRPKAPQKRNTSRHPPNAIIGPAVSRATRIPISPELLCMPRAVPVPLFRAIFEV